ncbi:MAG: C4-dicarboxylate ABC transporter substrate-binding protein [Rhodocyclales bacterium RIFCSPLOWO2_02_FULL_63_24]|nr:MAG: C4-dicarboxylate ABC transporter substrate-binding protein [Rhodocyclales bacterium RIFCSPLOWO2_02_FULL_63_24]
MRHVLDRIYGAAAWMAALFMIGTLAMILLSVSGRLLDFHIRGTDAYAGYCMAAAAFLALAHTLKHGEHIRVTLILDHAGPRLRHALELWSHAAGLFCAVLLAWFALRLAWQSFQFNDISQGTDATPLWIPQLGMALGTVIFAVAIADELVAVLRGDKLRHRAADGEPARSE